MSFEAEAMMGLKSAIREDVVALKHAIRDEMPALKREISNMNKNNVELINALNANTKSQNVSSLIRLYEISMQRPELKLFTQVETVEILRTIKGELVGIEPVKEKFKTK